MPWSVKARLLLSLPTTIPRGESGGFLPLLKNCPEGVS